MPPLTAMSPVCESPDMADPNVPQNKNPDQAQGPRALPQEGVLLRIFIGEDDRYEHRPLYEAVVFKARELHLAGATVLRGPLGFGRSSHIHTANILRLSTDLPMPLDLARSVLRLVRRSFSEGGGLGKGGSRSMSTISTSVSACVTFCNGNGMLGTP